MKVASAWSGHDCSFAVLDEGKPIVHDELERFIREKEPYGDGIKFLLEEFEGVEEIKHFATCHPKSKTYQYEESFNKLKSIIEKNEGELHVVGHHQSHAANAFFSSNLEKALIVTLDGGGVEANNFVTAATVWQGTGNKISHVHTFGLNNLNIGGIWTRVTRYVFNLQSGWPRGHQAGSVMAMAALGDRAKYHNDFYKMLTIPEENFRASHKPAGQPKGANVGTDPKHPYLQKWREIADSSDEERYNIAAGLQSATEAVLQEFLTQLFAQVPTKNLCMSGGVTLNCVAIGKIKEWFPFIENLYIPPTPHDGGLTLGAAQYVWHHVLDNERCVWEDNFTPYLGRTYSKELVLEALEEKKDSINHSEATDEDVIALLDSQKIVSVFGGGSESGRRALGSRSILADPRSDKMKDLINEKVKHRQWYRPFAPSMLREKVEEWFTRDDDSPYMNIVLNFKDDKKDLVPAVVHVDGTARVQTVTENDNSWYYNFIKKWDEKTGVPIVLNTSFNDREPICETPSHALNCYLGTDIDYLYFYDYNVLVEKK